MNTTHPSGPLPPWRSIVLGLLAPLLVLLERCAYYGTRSILVMWFIVDFGLDEELAYGWYGWLMAALIASSLLGGVLALLTGPYALLVLGSVLLVAAYATLPLGPDYGLYLPMYLPLGLLIVGQGLLKPSVYAIAGAQFRERFANLRAGTLAAVYAAVNVAGIVSVGAAHAVLEESGPLVVFNLSAALSVAVVILAVVIWATAWGRATEPALDATAGRRFLGGAALLPVAFLFWMLATASYASSWGHTPSWMESVNPAAVVSTCGLVVLVALAAQALRWRIPAMPVISLALLMTVPGAAILLLPHSLFSTVLIFGSIVIIAIPEALLASFALSRLAGDLPSRLSPLLFALWFVSGYLGTRAGQVLGDWLPGWVLLLACMLATLVLAGAALLAWKPLERFAFLPVGMLPRDDSAPAAS